MGASSTDHHPCHRSRPEPGRQGAFAAVAAQPGAAPAGLRVHFVRTWVAALYSLQNCMMFTPCTRHGGREGTQPVARLVEGGHLAPDSSS